MRWLYKLPLRFRSLFKRGRVELELSDELRFHLEKLTEEYVAKGMMPKEARYAALRELGGVDQIKEECRDMRRVGRIENLVQDVRFGLRMLAKSPGFTSVTVLTLALGIGANAAIFSVVYGVLLRPLPFADAGRLVRIYQANAQKGLSHMMNSPADIQDARVQNTVFEDITPYREEGATLTGRGVPESVRFAMVPAGLFGIMRVHPLVGRIFLPEEQQKGHDQVVILSHSLWQRRFGGDPNIAGKTATLDGKIYTVVGVTPAGFHFPAFEPPLRTELWVPLTDLPQSGTDLRGNRDMPAVARLKSTATLARAQLEMDTISKHLEQSYAPDRGWRFNILNLQQDMVGNVQTPILIIFAAVSFVLLIACTNVANLLLARAAGRQREMAIRRAVGAGRGRVIRQLLTESLLLALAGGALGLLVALGGVETLKAVAPKDIPRLAEVSLNGPVLSFTFTVSVLVGVLFGIAPAWRASAAPSSAAVKDGFMTTLEGYRFARTQHLRNLLVISQVALSLVLLVGAGLVLRSFLRLTSVELGFNPSHVLTFYTQLSSEKYKTGADKLGLLERTRESLNALSGVESVSFSTFLPLASYATTSFEIEGQPAPPPGQEPEVGYKAISSGYFHTLQIPVLEGREFTEADRKGAPPVVIVNRAFVRRYFPNRQALGRRIRLRWGMETQAREVVGVVGDVRDSALQVEASPECYEPLSQAWVPPGAAFIVRTSADPYNMASAVLHAALAVDKDQPIGNVQSMGQLLSDYTAAVRFPAGLLVSFSLLALTLAAVGLYGVLSYSVNQQTHEIGVRMALGAQRGDLLRQVIKEGMALIATGMAIGIAGAVALTHFLGSLLFEVTPTDPRTFVGVSLLLAGVALVACYIPARRATKVDPMVALRYQ